MGNVEAVRSMYEAFGRGDVGTILERMTEDVDWEYESVDHGVEHLRHRRGRPASRSSSPVCRAPSSSASNRCPCSRATTRSLRSSVSR